MLSNTPASYGAVAKTFHWLTALLILSAIPLGIIASDLAYEIQQSDLAPDDSMVARTALLFSLHKTIGVTIFFVALLRIVWTLTQTKPGLLNGDRKAEARLAETVHWLLYGSLVAVPMTGWIHHAATTGFAPIWWPFGQNLPFVPKDHATADFFDTLHYLLQWVLVVAVSLHIAGALKHHVIDRDATLRRMLPGRISAQPTQAQPGQMLPLIAALAVWVGVLGGAGYLGWFSHSHDQAEPQTTSLAEVDSDWSVQEGQLQITIRQLNSDVTGGFEDWTADISYTEAPDSDGKHGAVEVTVAIGSLSIGSVTNQALGSDFFDAGTFPTASFQAELISTASGQVASGTLTIRDQAVPVSMPVVIEVENNTARASGQLTIDRREFGVGLGVKDEGSLGFNVKIDFSLTAQRES